MWIFRIYVCLEWVLLFDIRAVFILVIFWECITQMTWMFRNSQLCTLLFNDLLHGKFLRLFNCCLFNKRRLFFNWTDCRRNLWFEWWFYRLRHFTFCIISILNWRRIFSITSWKKSRMIFNRLKNTFFALAEKLIIYFGNESFLRILFFIKTDWLVFTEMGCFQATIASKPSVFANLASERSKIYTLIRL